MKMIQNKQILTPEIHMEIEIQMMKIILVEESLRKVHINLHKQKNKINQ